MGRVGRGRLRWGDWWLRRGVKGIECEGMNGGRESSGTSRERDSGWGHVSMSFDFIIPPVVPIIEEEELDGLINTKTHL